MKKEISASVARKQIIAGTMKEGQTVGGGLDLRGTGITTLPDNLTVGGGLDLRGTGIKNKKYKKLKDGDYKPGQYLYADGILTHVRSKRTIKGSIVYYVGKIKEKNVISDGTYYSHCKNARQGIADLLFKAAKDRGSDQYKDVRLEDTFPPEELMTMYRIITGACLQGTENFVQSLGKLKSTYSIKEVIDLVDGQYGSEAFKKFFVGEQE